MSADGDVRTRFNSLVGDLDYPMVIVTTRSEAGEPAGCLVGFATQCSIDPPPSHARVHLEGQLHYRAASTAQALAGHFVPSTATALAELFGGNTGDEVDKFPCCDWREGPAGVPILCECRNWFVGSVLERRPLGDHLGFVLDPVEVQHEVPQAEFTFHRARRIEPGHEA